MTLRYGDASKIGLRGKEVYFFHNYNELRASGGSLSWTVSILDSVCSIRQERSYASCVLQKVLNLLVEDALQFTRLRVIAYFSIILGLPRGWPNSCLGK